MKKCMKKKNIIMYIVIVAMLIIGILGSIVISNNTTEEKVMKNEILQIDLKGKKVEELTWEEYQELSIDQKAVLVDYFESMDEYYDWYETVSLENKETENNIIDIDLKGKKAEEFTWNDYKELSIDEQAIFPDCFKSYDDFKEWQDKNEPKE